MNCFESLFENNKKFEYLFEKRNTNSFEVLSFSKTKDLQETPYYIVEFSDGSVEKFDVSTAAEAYEIASKKNIVQKISYKPVGWKAIA